MFKGKLPVQVTMGDWRNMLIDSFCKHEGVNYMPAAMHKAICWSKSNPFLESMDFVWYGPQFAHECTNRDTVAK